MKVQLESTSKIVTLKVNGAAFPARVWEGETERGVYVHAYITLIAALREDDNTEFERDLLECRAPSPDVANLPVSMIL